MYQNHRMALQLSVLVEKELNTNLISINADMLSKYGIKSPIAPYKQYTPLM